MSMPPWGQEPEQPIDPPPPPAPYQPYAAPPSPYGAFPVTPPTNGMAIGSLVVSIASVVFCCGLPGIVGAILGHVARRQIRERGESGEGLALGGIIVGWLAFGVALLVVIGYLVFFVVLVSASNSYDDCYTDSNGSYVCD